MNTRCINSIELITNNNEFIKVTNEEFKNLYVANIDNNGDEINYDREGNNYYANFFMVKLISDSPIIDRIVEKKDIIAVNINFDDMSMIFNVAKKRISNNGILSNIYQECFFDEEDLCILITDKCIKYKKELFV